MPIELPALDDKTYDDLVAEARAALPGAYAGWTDHNPSDPGIMLVELFAWLSEMLIYRTGRVPDPSMRAFVRLLEGRPAAPGAEGELDASVGAALSALRERYRAVTADDYERLAAERWPASPEAAALPEGEGALLRVHCLPERNLGAPTSAAPGQVSLIVVPAAGAGTAPWLGPGMALTAALHAFFRDRRLVATRLHVGGPAYARIDLKVTLRLRDDARADDVREGARAALAAAFDPRFGGPAGGGWPFGRDVHAAEIYATLDGVRGVESVESVGLDAPGLPPERDIKRDGAVVGVALEPHELPHVDPAHIELTLKERRGGKWETVP
jgi:hypothetical protein